MSHYSINPESSKRLISVYEGNLVFQKVILLLNSVYTFINKITLLSDKILQYFTKLIFNYM